MKRKLTLILIVTLFLCSLTGCSNKEIKICYTVYPIEYILNRIAGNRVQICKISTEEPIQTAHVIEDREEVMKDVTLILQIGGLEPYWPIYGNEFKETAHVIDLSSISALYDFRRYTNSEVAGSSITVESNYYEGDIFKSIDTYSKDPNLWLDPIAMTSMARTIKDWLVTNYPEEASFFESNFKDLEADLVRLDAEFSSLEAANIQFVSVTPSFGNWQRSYNVGVYPLILSKYGALPTEEQLTAMIERIKEDKVKYIVKEANLTEEMLELYEKVKKECALTEIKLSNLSTLTEAEFNENKDYLTIMYDNLSTLEKNQ